MSRKPLAAVMAGGQIGPDGESSSQELIVVCDDGSAFMFNWREGEWTGLKPIPGTDADHSGEDFVAWHDRTQGKRP
jgi:hypothetical protein